MLKDGAIGDILYTRVYWNTTAIWTKNREPGQSEAMHEHTGRGRIVVLLTGIHAKVKLMDGTASEMNLPAGEVRWSQGPVAHAGTNAGDQRFDMILIEVK